MSDLLNSLLNPASTTGSFVYKAGITVAADFPTSLAVQIGWVYYIVADVTDNDATKTNTGQSFRLGDLIAWDGSAWTDITGIELWIDDTTDITVITADRGQKAAYTKIGDTDLSNYLKISWNENDTNDRTLNLKLNSDNRTLDLSENFTIGDGFDVSITAEDANSSIVLNNALLEAEHTASATQRTIKVATGTDANATITVEGTASITNQDTTDNADVTFNGATLSSLTTAGGIVQTSVAGVLSTSVTLPDGTLATTQIASDNSTKLATTAYVTTAVGAIDTWDEIMHLGSSFTVANTENLSATITQNDVTNNPAALIIANTGSGNDITLPNTTSIKNGVAVFGTSVGANGAVLTGGTNTFNIVNGTASLDIAEGSALDVNANLTVEAASIVNQDLSSDNAPLFSGVTLTSARAQMILNGTQTGSQGNYCDINGTNSSGDGAQISWRRVDNDDATDLLFYTAATGAGLTEGFRITSTNTIFFPGLGGAAVGSLKAVYFNTGTGELTYDNA